MPLRCNTPHGEELAFCHTLQSWEALRARNALDRHLSMPCCGSAVVLRKSRHGVLHFVHTRRGECTSTAESAEHILLKDILAKAATQSGWVARTEVSGNTAYGEAWTADVLCTKPTARKSVAFEVQWSRQTCEETEIRQQRYRNSGVRCLWLMRELKVPSSRNTPAFALHFLKDDRPLVLLPSASWDPDYRGPKTGPGDERAWGQRIPLDTFAIGALTGKLKFAPLIGQTVPVRVVGAESTCWKCKQTTKTVQWLAVLADAICPGFGTLNISLEVLDAGPGRGMEWVRRHLPAERLRSFGIGELKPRFSKTMGEAYLSNGCVHCDALQGRFFDHELFYDATPVFDIEALVESWFIQEETAKEFNRWWFDLQKPDE
jgi:hypothetical protein